MSQGNPQSELGDKTLKEFQEDQHDPIKEEDGDSGNYSNDVRKFLEDIKQTPRERATTPNDNIRHRPPQKDFGPINAFLDARIAGKISNVNDL